MAKNKLAISLISLNQAEYLKKLLPTIYNSTIINQIKVYLVANRCTDETVNFVRQNYPEIDLFINKNKTGYGGNHNINLKRSNSEFFIIMNSDMLVYPKTFENLITFFENKKDVGLVSPQILNSDKTIQFTNKRYPTLIDLFLRKFCPSSLSFLVKERMLKYEIRDKDYNQTMEVPLLSGSFIAAKSSLLKSIGGFDNSFFLYFEDFDLCRRIQRLGYRTIFFPKAKAVHFWERSAHKNIRYTLFFVRSAIRYFSKWGWKLY